MKYFVWQSDDQAPGTCHTSLEMWGNLHRGHSASTAFNKFDGLIESMQQLITTHAPSFGVTNKSLEKYRVSEKKILYYITCLKVQTGTKNQKHSNQKKYSRVVSRGLFIRQFMTLNNSVF